MPARQQTLCAAIDWSNDLLGEPERALFRRLGVFVGGCTLEAAETVCNAHGDLSVDVLDSVAELVDKGLPRQQETDDGDPRLFMLEMIREYALDRLNPTEADTLRPTHAAHYLALAERAEPELESPGQASWHARLERERDNLRAALQWIQEQRDADLSRRSMSARPPPQGWRWASRRSRRQGAGWRWSEPWPRRWRTATDPRVRTRVRA